MSQSDDPFASTLSQPSQPAPAPTKRLLFKNRQRNVPKPEPEVDATEAVDFFSRSKEIFPAAIEEQREREERRRKRKEKEKHKENVKSEKNASFIESDSDYGERKAKRNRSSQEFTPPKNRRRSGSTKTSAKYTSPFHQKQAQHLQEVIALDDSDEDLLPTSKSPPRKASSSTKPTTRKPPRLYGAFLSDSESETEAPAPITHTNRSPSLEMLDPALPEDQDEMFPELVAEARAKEAAAKAQALSDLQAKLRRPSAITSDSNTGSNSPGFSRPLGVDAAAAPSSPAVPQVVQDPVIQILVTSQLPGTVPLVVKRKLTQRFKDVRMAWCDVQSVSDVSPSRRMTESEKSSIFLTWRGRRIWDSGNGLSIGVRVGRNGTVVDENGEVLGEGDEGKVNLEAWTQEWYDKVKSEAKRATNVAAAQAGDRIELSDDEDVEAQAQAEAEREKEKAAIRIVLKAKDAEVVKLKVRPITSVSKLVGAWRSQRDVEEGKDVELWFEGERLEEEGTVEEADIEDMCVVDVIVR